MADTSVSQNSSENPGPQDFTLIGEGGSPLHGESASLKV